MKREILMKEVGFKDFHPEDFSAIEELWDICSMGGSERKDSAETILRCNEHGGKFIILEHIPEKRIVGTNWMTYDGRRVFLHHFCIHPDYRGYGLGKLLGDESMKFIKALGSQVKLEVHKTNLAAKKLYDKMGFFAFEDYDIYMIRDLDDV